MPLDACVPANQSKHFTTDRCDPYFMMTQQRPSGQGRNPVLRTVSGQDIEVGAEVSTQALHVNEFGPAAERIEALINPEFY